MTGKKLKLGIAGLGRGFTVLLPTLAHHPRIEVVAAADPRDAARDRFEADFGGTSYENIAALCTDAAVEAVYIATPHEMHADHAVIAAEAGKHVLVEKPMALSVEDCTRMIAAAQAAGVHLLVGPSHSYDAPVRLARQIIDAGDCGPVRMITALNFTDFLYRPRRPEEFDTALGGGVVFSQGAHQVDVARYLCGGMVESVYATTGDFDPDRPTDGAYSAILKFESGAAATLTYSGYGHFDSDEFCGWRGETGRQKDPADHGAARRALRSFGGAEAEAALKAARAYGGEESAVLPAKPPTGLSHEHFGLLIISCAHADIRPMPDGVRIYRDDAVEFIPLDPPAVPRAEVMDELASVILDGEAPFHTGEWGRATLEACIAIAQSGRGDGEIRLTCQAPA